jgi:two-component system chemotaxis response regulator CheB
LISDNRKIKVLVVNDSLTVREYLCDIVRSSKTLELSGSARDGADAIKKVLHMHPDVILLDLEMPNMDGLTFIEHIMNQAKPIAIIVVSSYGDLRSSTSNGRASNSSNTIDSPKEDDVVDDRIIFDCLDAGAVDFVSIPQFLKQELSKWAVKERPSQDLVSRIEIAAQVNTRMLRPKTVSYDNEEMMKEKRKKHLPAQDPQFSQLHRSKNDEVIMLIVIGASTGGPRVIAEILSKLPADLGAGILIVQHMPSSFTSGFARHLDRISRFKVSEAKDGDRLLAGRAFVAPGDHHVLVDRGGVLKLDKSAKRHGVRPSINVSMVSASNVFGKRTIGILLSGMGEDGAFGLKMIKRRGGKTIAQDPSSSVVFGMAKSAFDLGAVDVMVAGDKIGETLVKTVDEINKSQMNGNQSKKMEALYQRDV